MIYKLFRFVIQKRWQRHRCMDITILDWHAKIFGNWWVRSAQRSSGLINLACRLKGKLVTLTGATLPSRTTLPSRRQMREKGMNVLRDHWRADKANGQFRSSPYNIFFCSDVLNKAISLCWRWCGISMAAIMYLGLFCFF